MREPPFNEDYAPELFYNLMAKLKEMVGSRVISGFRGVVDYYYYMGVACARKWPKKPQAQRSPEVRAQWPIWRQAAILWPLLSPAVKQSYFDMAVSTNLTARDLFFRGYISGTLRYYIPVDELEES